MATYRRRRQSLSSPKPLVAFLLIASFGILFAGCSPKEEEPQPEEFTFTAEDVARFKELSNKAEAGLDSLNDEGGPRLHLEEDKDVPVLDMSMVKKYSSIRSGPAATGENLYRITNEFLNVRSAPKVTADSVDRLDQGDIVELLEFIDAAWAHIKLPNDRDGYVAQRYIAKLTSESALAEEKEKFKDRYFVDFGFLNVRKAADTHSEKLGELQGQSFVNVLSKDDVWARIPFEGKEGYVAVEYLSPFLPNFLVRQEKFTFPVLIYRASQKGVVNSLPKHIDALKQSGLRLITMRQFKDLLTQQEERDIRMEPGTVALAITGIKPENIEEISDVLRASAVKGTLFLETQHLGINGITQKQVLTLLANGHDLQSAGHTGDDLRSLTNAQVELELKQSRKILEEYTGRGVFAISYPMGGVNARVMKLAEESGYLVGVGSGQERSFNREQLLRIPAFAISPSASAEEILGLVKGEE
ncbi:TPA: hypothetical protein DE059_02300 [Candidatus Peribacteria bacterium]|nr:hypothetical protein [Candidatus Peribacteria bacterium]